jgi:hypothetical protein
VLRSTTPAHVEKVRTQFLSLRQLIQGGVFSGRTPWQLSPVTEPFLIQASDSKRTKLAYYSPKDPFLSGPHDFTHSVRFAKCVRFELLKSPCRKRFDRFSRIGESVQFWSSGRSSGS